MRKKKMWALMLVGAMTMFSIMTGCGTTSTEESAAEVVENENAEAENTEAKTAETESAATENAEAKTDTILKVALQTDATITDYEANDLTNYFEEKLGIEIEFLFLPADATEAATKISLMISGGEELPDVLLTSQTGKLSDEAILQYGQAGIFLALNEYMADASVMPNYNAIPEADRVAMTNDMTSADGNIYAFPKFTASDWNQTPNRIFINKAWLDKLGLAVPTTTQELKEVLVAFRDQDPNGNGTSDEIPVYGMQSGTYGQNTLAGLMNSFVYWDGGVTANKGLSLDGQTVIAPFTTDEWKAGLSYMHELYEEGLIAPGIFTDDNTQFKAMLNAETNVVGLVTMGSYGNYADAQTNANFAEMEMIEVMAGPEGVAYAPFVQSNAYGCMYIFSDSENIDTAIAFADEFYSETGSLVVRYGVEGVDWTKDLSGAENVTNCYVEMGLYDEITWLRINDVWSENKASIWQDAAVWYLSEETLCTMGIAGSEYNPDDVYNLRASNLEYYADKHPEELLPALKYTVEESEQILESLTNIPAYVHQTMAEFITGTRDIESGWDTYLSELENMGLSAWLSAAQAAYDRVK